MSYEIDWEKGKFELSGERLMAQALRGNPGEEVVLEYLRPELRPVLASKGGSREGEILGPTVRLSRDLGLRETMITSGEIKRLRDRALTFREEGRTWYYVFLPTEAVVGVWRIREG